MGKRADGEGWVRERKDGRWEAVIQTGVDPVKSKPIYKSFYGKTQKEAVKKRDDYLKAVAAGTYVEPVKLLFGDWVNKHLELFVKPKVRESTYAKYMINNKTHIQPGLGGTELQKLSTEQIQAFYNEKAAVLSSSVVQILHQIVNRALRQAARQKKIASNPAEYTVRPAVKCKEIPPLTEKEVSKYLKVAKTDPLYPAFLLDLWSGLRKGELLALRWPVVNLDAKTITVQESLGRVQTRFDDDGEGPKSALVFSDPKTDAGKRELPIPDAVVKALRAHKAKQAEDRIFLGEAYQNSDLVFARPGGTPLEPRAFYGKHKALLKKAGLREEITVHTLRHTFGTLLAQAGENPANIQKLMGHANVRITLQTYCHTSMDDKRRAVEKLAKKIKG